MADTAAFGRRKWQAGTTSTSNSNLSLVIAVVIILAVLFLSTAVFVCEIVAQNILKLHDNYNDIVIPGSYNGILEVKTMPGIFILGATAVSGTLACLCGLALWELRNTARWNSAPSRMRTWTWVNLAAIVTNLVLVIACLAVTFAIQYRDDELETALQKGTDDSVSVFYSNFFGKAEVTRETFMCGAKDIDGWNEKWTDAGCGFARASRWMLIPSVMASAALLVYSGHQVWRQHFSKSRQSEGTAIPMR